MCTEDLQEIGTLSIFTNMHIQGPPDYVREVLLPLISLPLALIHSVWFAPSPLVHAGVKHFWDYKRLQQLSWDSEKTAEEEDTINF